MRILALDVGQRRIGLAVGDTGGGIATPVGALRRAAKARDVEAVLQEARKQQVERIVVGIPYGLGGSLGPWGRAVMSFCDALRAASPLPVDPWDERLSTLEAERGLRQAGAQPSRERARLDAASAAVILQSYLDAKRRGQGNVAAGLDALAAGQGRGTKTDAQ